VAIAKRVVDAYNRRDVDNCRRVATLNSSGGRLSRGPMGADCLTTERGRRKVAADTREKWEELQTIAAESATSATVLVRVGSWDVQRAAA